MYELPKGQTSLLFFDTEEEAVFVLQQEGQKLEKIAKRVWQEYYGSYTPKVYRRTGKTLEGIKLGIVKRDGAIGFQVVVTFEDKNMYHNSYVNKGQPKGHSVMLISSGWHSKNLEKRIGVRKRFTSYKGYNYLGKVIKEYLRDKHRKVSIEVVWTGKSNYTK